MAYNYLVTVKATGAQHLCEASSPSVAIADAAKDEITAERVDGNVLALLSKTLETRRVLPTPRTPAADGGAAGDPPAGDETDANTNEAGGEGQPAPSGGKGGSK